MTQEELQDMLQTSLAERAGLEELLAKQDKKDKKVISVYCANNNPADIYRTLKLLNQHKGMPIHDKEIVTKFKNNYPNSLTIKSICEFEDLRDIYSTYLESGGNDNE